MLSTFNSVDTMFCTENSYNKCVPTLYDGCLRLAIVNTNVVSTEYAPYDSPVHTAFRETYCLIHAFCVLMS